MKTRLAALALAALMLTGCGIAAPQPGPDAPGTSVPVETSPPGSPSPTAAPPSVEPSTLPVLAARETSHNGTPLTIALNTLHSGVHSTTVNFTVTNRGSEAWGYWTAMSSRQYNPDYSVDQVFVLDTVNGRRLLPARDADDGCVCSLLGSQKVGPGQSMVLSAVVAALPEDVATASVHIPLAGMFDDVPVTR
ncbi:MAG: hypothetical protein Q4F65_12655 [Propionibacteriaceae bacterium]|nr:hypothetical protein [Propionibacteriaceae bacterium]